jgi:excisionase family DNA binding protein
MNPKFLSKPPLLPPILVDSREAARRLSISPRTLWSLTKSGEIPSLKIGKSVRYRVSDLETWTEQKVNALSTCAISSIRTGV